MLVSTQNISKLQGLNIVWIFDHVSENISLCYILFEIIENFTQG